MKKGKRYLAFPAWAGSEHKKTGLVSISCGDRILYEYRRPLGKREGEPDYYFYLPIPETGEEIGVLGEDPLTWRFLHRTDEPEYPREDGDSIHYHAPFGFINDPNGCIYSEGIWHVYHQHNPFDTVWGNMTWGHAVSSDLVHFHFVSDVLFPDQDGVMYSGCGIRNERKAFGLPGEALLFFYTCAGGVEDTFSRDGCFTQRMAYSLDEGRTLEKYPGWEIPVMEKETRDPKVFWHEGSGSYCMVLYLAGNRFGLLRSADLQHWDLVQELDFPPMWECPDLIRLRDETSDREKWAFLSADGYYYLGSFDGYAFRGEGGMQKLYEGGLPYAAQTFSGVEGRTVQICWLRTENRGEIWTGMMGLPRELSLGKDRDGFYIRQSFVREAEGFLDRKDGFLIAEDRFVRESISPDGLLLKAGQLW